MNSVFLVMDTTNENKVIIPLSIVEEIRSTPQRCTNIVSTTHGRQYEALKVEIIEANTLSKYTTTKED